MLGEHGGHAFRKARDEPLGLALGREAGDAGELATDQVGHHHERARRADVDRHHAALARVDVEERRLASTLRLAGGALEDRALADQLVHEQADGTPPRLHQPREVGARDRLVGAHQVQHDPPVDRARCAARRDAVAVRVLVVHVPLR